ncbi:hypothetical protein Ahy_B08g090010 isoform A [Arachis hypogaea]|uniref:Uncharacterized protein n=1 Tax=Arachis hypogaea TaxID=3818 RepID=A0A444XZE9_ARAHY|nr:hypothetical protein Ahy_B08g090010 isoform A [Arachis hypogaea]
MLVQMEQKMVVKVDGTLREDDGGKSVLLEDGTLCKNGGGGPVQLVVGAVAASTPTYSGVTALMGWETRTADAGTEPRDGCQHSREREQRHLRLATKMMKKASSGSHRRPATRSRSRPNCWLPATGTDGRQWGCNKIHCSIKNYLAKMFENKLIEGKVYVFSNFLIEKSSGIYLSTAHSNTQPPSPSSSSPTSSPRIEGVVAAGGDRTVPLLFDLSLSELIVPLRALLQPCRLLLKPCRLLLLPLVFFFLVRRRHPLVSSSPSRRLAVTGVGFPFASARASCLWVTRTSSSPCFSSFQRVPTQFHYAGAACSSVLHPPLQHPCPLSFCPVLVLCFQGIT